MLMPWLAGRAALRRHAIKLRWWKPDEPLVFDLLWRPFPGLPVHELLVDEGYGEVGGFRIVFAPIEPEATIWVLSILRNDEPWTLSMQLILAARRNVALERGRVSSDNPFGE